MKAHVVIMIGFMTFLWMLVMITITIQFLVLANRQRRRPRTRGLLMDARGRRLGSYQRRDLHLPLPFHQAFTLCHESLRALPGARLQEMSRDQRLILARHKMSWRSMGEVIRFELTPMGEHDTLVRLTSKCWFPTEFIDLGKNEDNVNAIVGFLMMRTSRMLPSEPPPQSPPLRAPLAPGDLG